MKYLYFLILVLLLTSSIYASEPAIPMAFNVDADTLTPSQMHQLLAAGKAAWLESMRADRTMEMSSFFDQSQYDVKYYKIDITIDVANEYVDSSYVKIIIASLVDGLDTLELDFADSMPYGPSYPEQNFLRVDSVYNESGRLNFSHESHKIIVELDRPYNQGEEFSLSVRYHGMPWPRYRYASGTGKMGGEGLAFGKQRSMLGGTSEIPVAYTNCEPYGSRLWWPCKDRPDDKPDSVDIFATVPYPFYCASNGNLISIDIGQGTPEPRTFHYKVHYPIVTYLVSLAISEYIVWSDWYHYGPDDSMEIINHVYPELYEDTFDPLSNTPYAIGVYSDLYCQYPFINEKYGHAHWEAASAMEHQTCTSTMCDTWGTSEPIVVHELSHQWWGDMISCNSWHDIWLNEGFASYSEALYFEAKSGRDSYHNYMLGMQYFDDRSVYVYDTTWSNDVFNIVVYDKGAWVVHMLRHVIGDGVFFDLLHAYAESQYRFGSLTTDEFVTFCNNFTGKDLTEFFNDWVYGIMFPVYGSVFMSEQDLSDGQYWVYYYLMQTQTYGPEVFDLPVDLKFYSGTEVIKDTAIFCDSRIKMHIFKTPEPPDSIVLDPDDWILKKKFKMQWTYHMIPFPFDPVNQYVEFCDTIICRGGSGHNEFQVISGALPEGLTLNTGTGIITGVPETSGEFVFTIRADDVYSSSFDQYQFELTVNEVSGRPGDANLDGNVDILDIVFLINYKYKKGEAPSAAQMADPNNDCQIDILDIVYLINYRYKDGPGPLLGCATL